MTDREVGAQSTEFQECWDRDFASSPSKPLLICGFANGFFGDQALLSPGQYVAFTCFATYPYSRGSIHVEDPRSGYVFDAGFLRHKFDLSVMVWAYKQQREIARRLPFCISEVGIGHPKFPTGSAARLTASDYLNPSPTNINYSANDDMVIQDWVRGNANTIWHSLGTCAMKPMEKGGVVDANLNVHGTLNLKIADLSIVPENVGANTNNTALVIGEKAALIIASELAIEL
jgi:choline dehydrogenase-like flavoprotein